MSVTRRQFHALALGLLATSMSRTASAIEAVSSETQSSTFLNRLTFGATIDSVAEFDAMGLDAWLERELTSPLSDPALDARIAAAGLKMEYPAGGDGLGATWPGVNEMRPLGFYATASADLLPLLDFVDHPMAYEERIRPAREVQATSLMRAVHAEGQLREIMTQFWHDHFNVDSQRDQLTSAFYVPYDRVMRTNALGNFRELLTAVAQSPAMLYYLNNDESRASPANENYGRELLELHTFGAEHYYNDLYDNWVEVPGAPEGLAKGYIDQDVYEVARAFTGWSVGDGRATSEGDTAPMTGEFHYIDAWHDPYQKRILGVEFPPNAGPMEDGLKVIDLLARHPSTAQFIVRKLCRRLVTDNPDENLIARAAWVFNATADAPDQIAQVVRSIVTSEEFTASPPRKLKRPFEFLASYYRASGADLVSPSLTFHWLLSQTGWTQHEVKPPTGPSDMTEDWANTNSVNGLVTLALDGLEEWLGACKADLNAATPPTVKTLRDALTFWGNRMHAGRAPRTLLTAANEAFGASLNEALPKKATDREWTLRALTAVSSLTPEFMFR